MAKKLGLGQLSMKTLNDVREQLGTKFMSKLGNKLGLSQIEGLYLVQLGEKLGLHTELFNRGDRPNTDAMFAEETTRPNT